MSDDAWTYSEEPFTPLHIGPCAECGRTKQELRERDEELTRLTETVRSLRERLDAVGDYIASALTSLETGPGKDGYAYALLCAARAALANEVSQEEPGGSVGFEGEQK